MEKVTHLVLVSDQSKKGIQVINTIKGVADDLIEYEKIGAYDQSRTGRSH